MPYVSENSRYGDREFVDPTNPTVVVHLATGRERAQYGYRSHPRIPPASVYDALDGKTAGSVLSYASALGEVDYHTPTAHDRVNDRDFREEAQKPGIRSGSQTFTYTGPRHPGGDTDVIKRYSAIGNMSSIVTSEFPKDSDSRKIASGMMRKAVPEAPAWDLVRSVAEQKDSPRLFKAAHAFGRGAFKDISRTPSVRGTVAGNAQKYLAWIFGVQPTVSDIAYAAEAVSILSRSAGRILTDYRVSTRRLRVHQLQHETYQSSSGVAPGYSAQPIGLRGGDLLVSGTLYGSHPAHTRTTVECYADVQAQVRMFSTFSYYVPHPSGLASRLTGYNNKAKQLLGGGLTASTVYELSAYSWLLDWYVDFGGLLSYQQAVADNAVVASVSGYTTIQTSQAFARAASPAYTSYDPSTMTNLKVTGCSLAMASVSTTQLRRRPGGAYSLDRSGPLSGQQTAVLGALGLSRL